MTSLRRELSWQNLAACRPHHDVDRFVADGFFPVGRPRDKTKQMCGHCAVRGQCLAYAVTAELEGIWGGTTQHEREEIRRAHVS